MTPQPRNQNRPSSYNVTRNPSGVRQSTIALLAADPEARVLWDILMAGGSRGRMSKS